MIFWQRFRCELLRRFALYGITGFAFYRYLQVASKYGVAPKSFHVERVNNALSNIIDGTFLIPFGLTSWTPVKAVLSGHVYTVQLHEYIHYLLVWLGGGEAIADLYINMIDYVVVVCCCAAIAEFGLQIIRKSRNSCRMLIGWLIFLISLTSPFAYRMTMAAWQDVYFLLFTLIGYILLGRNKRKVGLAFLLYGSFWNYQWSMLLLIYYIALNWRGLLGFLQGRARIFSKFSSIDFVRADGLRPDLCNWSYLILYSISPIVSAIQAVALKFFYPSLVQSNSNLFFRIGIDSWSNVHHGGLLSSLQFLAGVRASACINMYQQFGEIAAFNCMLAIGTMFLLSAGSIVGYVMLARASNADAREFLLPLPFAYIIFVFIMQQAMAAHLHGYSIMFLPVYSIGSVFGLIRLTDYLTLARNWSTILLCVFSAGIAISGIRVNLLVGANG